MSNPTVSVIIAVYNRKKYVRRAIESVFSQTYKDTEIIVVDDGSNDNVKEVLEQYIKDNKIRYVYQENSGSMVARDTGVRNSRGKYIAILDSDDFWCDANKLEKQVRFLESHPDYVLAGGGIIKKDETGREVSRHLFYEEDEDIRKYILLGNMFVHSSVLFRKQSWHLVNGYCGVESNLASDWTFWLRLGKIGKFYNFQDYFVCYLQGVQNTSKYTLKKDLKLFIRLRKKFRNDYPNFRKALFIGRVHYICFFLPFRKQLHPIFLKLRKIIFNF